MLPMLTLGQMLPMFSVRGVLRVSYCQLRVSLSTQTVATLDAEADMPGAPFTVVGQHGRRDATYAPAAAATRTLTRCAEEVPVARGFIRDVLAGHPACFDAELLTCELVTNVVQHAADAGAVTVTVMRRGPVVHVDVIDDGRTGLPHWREADGQDEGGRGFQLVNEIALRWGFLRERAGTCVWFELAAW
jgi:anti-sigma regulatory factor (Ser/Thr protein kinase)